MPTPYTLLDGKRTTKVTYLKQALKHYKNRHQPYWKRIHCHWFYSYVFHLAYSHTYFAVADGPMVHYMIRVYQSAGESKITSGAVKEINGLSVVISPIYSPHCLNRIQKLPCFIMLIKFIILVLCYIRYFHNAYFLLLLQLGQVVCYIDMHIYCVITILTILNVFNSVKSDIPRIVSVSGNWTEIS